MILVIITKIPPDIIPIKALINIEFDDLILLFVILFDELILSVFNSSIYVWIILFVFE